MKLLTFEFEHGLCKKSLATENLYIKRMNPSQKGILNITLYTQLAFDFFPHKTGCLKQFYAR